MCRRNLGCGVNRESTIYFKNKENNVWEGFPTCPEYIRMSKKKTIITCIELIEISQKIYYIFAKISCQSFFGHFKSTLDEPSPTGFL